MIGTDQMTRKNAETVTVACIDCHRYIDVPLTVEQEAAWRCGALIQNVTPQLEDKQDFRELLISGTCGPCFDALFGDEEGNR